MSRNESEEEQMDGLCLDSQKIPNDIEEGLEHVGVDS